MSEMGLDLWGQGKWWNTRFWHANQQMRMDDMSEGVRAVFSRATDKMDAIAENLANASTPGYRSAFVLPKNFVGELNGRLIGHQWRTGTDLTAGAIRMTDRPLDFALQGDGFFVVRSEMGEFLTRSGSFELSQDGTLTTSSGLEVMGDDNEPIRVPDGTRVETLVAGEDGTLLAGDRKIGQLRLERVDSEEQLRRVGSTLFIASPENRQPAEETRVVGRALESSNSATFQELSDMLVLTRSVEAAQRAQSDEAQAQKKMMEALS